MLSLEHTNVLSLVGICIEGEMPLLVLPFMPNGNILEFVRYHREQLLLSSTAEPQVPMFYRIKARNIKNLI